MYPDIITFSKSFECRLREYELIFEFEHNSRCSDIVSIWSSLFQDYVTVEVGWQALWILSEENCSKHNLLHPTRVLVEVNEFTWSELTANVTVVGVQEDILLPSVLDVPIIEIHPIKCKDYLERNLTAVADWLDKCRFFFKYLWFPWDFLINVNIRDWYDEHLKNRLHLQCEIQNNYFDKRTTHYLKELIAEAHRCNDVQINTEDFKKMSIETYIRKRQIQAELDLFEDPELRDAMVDTKLTVADVNDIFPEVRLVWNGGDMEQLSDFLNIAKPHIGANVTVRVSENLLETLRKCKIGDTVILSPGMHSLQQFEMMYGGVLKGIAESTETVITEPLAETKRAALLECSGAISFENITFQRQKGTVIQVFQNIVKIKNCRILSKGDYSTKGIIVVPGCHIEIDNCELVGLGTAITLHKTASAEIINTRITNCCDGISISDGVSLSLKCVDISLCSGYGIRIDSSTFDSSTPLVGEMSILSDGALPDSNVRFTSTVVTGNKKGNVLVRSTNSTFAMQSFSDDEDSFNTTISLSDDNFVEEVCSPTLVNTIGKLRIAMEVRSGTEI